MTLEVKHRYCFLMISLPLVIITTPHSRRAQPLLESLKSDSRFVVTQIPATMGQEMKSPLESTLMEEVSNYGRPLTQNERACAVSHTKARKLIHESALGGIVLEDDARITDLDKLYSLSLSFLQESTGKRNVLSLISYFPNSPKTQSQTQKKKFFRLLSSAPLAVGAAITPFAAGQLIDNFAKGSFVADWPNSKCVFYILEVGVINHGDVETESIIGDVGSRVDGNYFEHLSYKTFARILRRLSQKVDTLRISNIQS